MKKLILLIIVIAFISFIYTQYKNSLQESKKEHKEELQTEQIDIVTEQADFDYNLVLKSSTIEWTGSTILKSHVGTLDFVFGGANRENNLLSGSVVVDMTTVAGDAGDTLNGHLKSADFFEVETYPQALLSFIETADGIFEGILKIKNIEQSVSFVVEKNMIDGVLELHTNLSFDRTTYGITFKSASLVDVIKDQAIKDDIDLDVTLTLIQS